MRTLSSKKFGDETEKCLKRRVLIEKHNGLAVVR